MIVELATFFMILIIGGLAYLSLYYTHYYFLDALVDALPEYFVNSYTGFMESLIYWMPALILFGAVAYFITATIRGRPDETFSY